LFINFLQMLIQLWRSYLNCEYCSLWCRQRQWLPRVH